jgi:phage FluMu protein Com
MTKPIYIDPNCDECGTALVLYTQAGFNDEFQCPRCKSFRILDVPNEVTKETRMTVRCKFKLNKIVQRASGYGGWDLEFNAVYSNDPGSENKKFWEATPSGTFTFCCLKKDVVEQFELGEEYYFDISPATAPVPD